jgi:immune inhibitor A
VSVHPGGGQILVVDSHPAPNVSPDGKGCLRERGQTWDSSFGFEAHSVTLHEYQGSGNQLREAVDNAPAVSSFVDSGANAYWDARIPFNSVKLPVSGLRIDLLSVSSDGATDQVRIQ